MLNAFKKVFGQRTQPPIEKGSHTLSGKKVEVGKSSGPKAYGEWKKMPSWADKLGYHFKNLFERVFSLNTGIQVENIKGLKALTAARVNPVDVFNDLSGIVTGWEIREIFEERKEQTRQLPFDEKIRSKMGLEKLNNEQLLRMKSNLETLNAKGFDKALENLAKEPGDSKVKDLINYSLVLLNTILKDEVALQLGSELEETTAKEPDEKLMNNLQSALETSGLKQMIFKSKEENAQFLQSLKLEANKEQQETTQEIIFGQSFEISKNFVKDEKRSTFQLQRYGEKEPKTLYFRNEEERKKSYEEMLEFFGYDKKRENEENMIPIVEENFSITYSSPKDLKNKEAAERLYQFTLWGNQALDGIPFEAGSEGITKIMSSESVLDTDLERLKKSPFYVKSEDEGIFYLIGQEEREYKKVFTRDALGRFHLTASFKTSPSKIALFRESKNYASETEDVNSKKMVYKHVLELDLSDNPSEGFTFKPKKSSIWYQIPQPPLEDVLLD